MKNYRTLLVVALLAGVPACSMLSGDDTEVRVVEQQEIDVGRVFVSKERQQCEDDTGLPLDATKAILENAGIRVFSSACALVTGKMSAALCGSPTLHINIHGIDVTQFEEAANLGFTPLSTLKDEDLGYDPEACD